MKRKPKQKLTATQKKRLVKISIVFLCVVFLWLIFAPDMGFISWYRRQQTIDQLHQQKAMLEKENEELRNEIEKIENDIDYFEKLAREKHGLLKKNEIIFDFNENDKKKN